MKRLAGALLVLALTGAASAEPVTIAATGDILFGRYKPGWYYDQKEPHYRIVQRTADGWGDVAPSLRRADVTFGNLETPVLDEPPRLVITHSLAFRADPFRVGELRDAGYDVLSIANNHMNNMGKLAPAETRRHLESQGLRAVGAGATVADAYRPALFTVRGRRVAFLAFTQLLNGGAAVSDAGAIALEPPKSWMDVAVPAVVAARRYLGADFVIVSVHWGQEKAPHPSTRQVRDARALIDAGADVVLGHHPHVLQDFERWHGGLIAYSLGNFFFDWHVLDWRQTVILHAELDGEGPLRHVGAVELEPVLIARWLKVPRRARGRDYATLVKKLAKIAKGIVFTTEPTTPYPVDDTSANASPG